MLCTSDQRTKCVATAILLCLLAPLVSSAEENPISSEILVADSPGFSSSNHPLVLHMPGRFYRGPSSRNRPEATNQAHPTYWQNKYQTHPSNLQTNWRQQYVTHQTTHVNNQQQTYQSGHHESTVVVPKPSVAPVPLWQQKERPSEIRPIGTRQHPQQRYPSYGHVKKELTLHSTVRPLFSWVEPPPTTTPVRQPTSNSFVHHYGTHSSSRPKPSQNNEENNIPRLVPNFYQWARPRVEPPIPQPLNMHHNQGTNNNVHSCRGGHYNRHRGQNNRNRPHYPYWLGSDNQTKAAAQEIDRKQALQPSSGNRPSGNNWRSWNQRQDERSRAEIQQTFNNKWADDRRRPAPYPVAARPSSSSEVHIVHPPLIVRPQHPTPYRPRTGVNRGWFKVTNPSADVVFKLKPPVMNTPRQPITPTPQPDINSYGYTVLPQRPHHQSIPHHHSVVTQQITTTETPFTNDVLFQENERLGIHGMETRNQQGYYGGEILTPRETARPVHPKIKSIHPEHNNVVNYRGNDNEVVHRFDGHRSKPDDDFKDYSTPKNNIESTPVVHFLPVVPPQNPVFKTSKKEEVTCLHKNFQSAPSVPNSVIKYVRLVESDGGDGGYVEAEYICNPGFRLVGVEQPARLYCRGKEWVGDVPSCEPDPRYRRCSHNNGECEHDCKDDVEGRAVCSCKPGYILMEETKCEDINECAPNDGRGPCQGGCENTPGSFKCNCYGIPNTVLAEDRHHCRREDECPPNHGCSHMCINTRGGPFCLCPDGFFLGGDWKTCELIPAEVKKKVEKASNNEVKSEGEDSFILIPKEDESGEEKSAEASAEKVKEDDKRNDVTLTGHEEKSKEEEEQKKEAEKKNIEDEERQRKEENKREEEEKKREEEERKREAEERKREEEERKREEEERKREEEERKREEEERKREEEERKREDEERKRELEEKKREEEEKKQLEEEEKNKEEEKKREEEERNRKEEEKKREEEERKQEEEVRKQDQEEGKQEEEGGKQEEEERKQEEEEGKQEEEEGKQEEEERKQEEEMRKREEEERRRVEEERKREEEEKIQEEERKREEEERKREEEERKQEEKERKREEEERKREEEEKKREEEERKREEEERRREEEERKREEEERKREDEERKREEETRKREEEERKRAAEDRKQEGDENELRRVEEERRREEQRRLESERTHEEEIKKDYDENPSEDGDENEVDEDGEDGDENERSSNTSMGVKSNSEERETDTEENREKIASSEEEQNNLQPVHQNIPEDRPEAKGEIEKVKKSEDSESGGFQNKVDGRENDKLNEHEKEKEEEDENADEIDENGEGADGDYRGSSEEWQDKSQEEENAKEEDPDNDNDGEENEIERNTSSPGTKGETSGEIKDGEEQEKNRTAEKSVPTDGSAGPEAGQDKITEKERVAEENKSTEEGLNHSGTGKKSSENEVEEVEEEENGDDEDEEEDEEGTNEQVKQTEDERREMERKEEQKIRQQEEEDKRKIREKEETRQRLDEERRRQREEEEEEERRRQREEDEDEDEGEEEEEEEEGQEVEEEEEGSSGRDKDAGSEGEDREYIDDQPITEENKNGGKDEPWIACPEDIVLELREVNSKVFVQIPRPKTSVKISWERDVKSLPAWGKRLKTTLPVGDALVRYIATNPTTGRTASCSVLISVKTPEAPKVLSCPQDLHLYAAKGSRAVRAHWEEPIFEDNVGIVRLHRTKGSGSRFPIGVSKVIYTATDAAGNISQCSFEVNVHYA